MPSLKALYLLLFSIVVLLGGIALFNYKVDPRCYYSCPEVDLQKSSVNTYYKTAQTIVAHPEAEQLILGSSRAQTTPPQWVEQVTGLKTINGATEGAEVMTKIIFSNMAKEKTKLKRVIWFADYFELISENVDGNIKNTEALRQYLPTESGIANPWITASHWQSLIDHNTTEASLFHLQHMRSTKIDNGPGSDLYEDCMKPDYKGKETPESLAREVQMLYQNYVTGPIKYPQSESAWNRLVEQVSKLKGEGIEVVVVIIPYNPVFLQKLKIEHFDIYEHHEKWIQKLKNLSEGLNAKVKVYDTFNGIDGDDGSPKYWNDGVHFTCYGSMKLIEPILKELQQN
ncbi:hypothetical protein [Bdellovibrio sp. HCB209]|uniref:hypothetical protein n=1 Tax=Bdellovibrio sp. HCB209 TaxID=3394354 RepID=UPI0039B4E791